MKFYAIVILSLSACTAVVEHHPTVGLATQHYAEAWCTRLQECSSEGPQLFVSVDECEASLARAVKAPDETDACNEAQATQCDNDTEALACDQIRSFERPDSCKACLVLDTE